MVRKLSHLPAEVSGWVKNGIGLSVFHSSQLTEAEAAVLSEGFLHMGFTPAEKEWEKLWKGKIIVQYKNGK